MLIVDKTGKVAPLSERPERALRVPQGGRTLPFNQRFSQVWQLSKTFFARMVLDSGLRRALDQGDLVVHFQPQANLATGRVECVEALVRWQHPSRGLVGPSEFISSAEESGLINQLGEWVLHAACAQSRLWHEDGLPSLRVAVNLSARQLEQPNLVDMVAVVLKEHKVNPDLLELELTESSAMENPDLAVRVLQDLRSLGVRIAMDDFGIGYSSFAHLKDLPINVLKIDRSIVAGIGRERNAASINAAIIVMGHSLQLEVVAEGVETEAQRMFLKEKRCDRLQGFLLSHPEPAEALGSLLNDSAQDLAA